MAITLPMAQAFVASAASTFLIGQSLRILLGKGKPDPVQAEFRPTKAQRGVQLPLLIGRDQLAPVVMSEFDRSVRLEALSGGAGGKGVGAAGGGQSNEVVYSKFVMGFGVGPAHRLREVKYNGERIWPAEGEYTIGITQHSHPSGSELETTGEHNVGPFRIYWGEIDQPIDTDATRADRDRYPLQTRFPYVMWLYWPDMRLGGAGTLGNVLIDLEARPFLDDNTYARASVGDTYEDVVADSNGGAGGGNLGGSSDPWLRNAFSVDEANCQQVLRYLPNSLPRQIKIGGDWEAEFATGNFFALKYPNRSPRTGVCIDANHDGGEVITRPFSDYDIRLIDQQMDTAAWTKTLTNLNVGTVVSVPAGTDTTLPGVMIHDPGSGIVSNVEMFDLNALGTGFGAHTLDVDGLPESGGFTPPLMGDSQRAGNGFNLLRFYYKALSPGGGAGVVLNVEMGDVLGSATSAAGATFAANIGSVTVSNIDSALGASASAIRVGGSPWFLCTILLATGNTPLNTIAATGILRTRFQLQTPGGLRTARIVVARGTHPLSTTDEMVTLSFSPATTVTGITTVDVPIELSGLYDYVGELCPYVADPDGDQGANAAHMLYQLLFETDPHGLGLDTDYWDTVSLQTIGAELATEGLRTHIIIEEHQTVQENLSNLLLEVGINIAWDLTQGKYVFSLRRGVDVDAIIPEGMLHGPLPNRLRRMDSNPTRAYVFTFPVASEGYQTRSVEADDIGNVATVERSGVETDALRTPRDVVVAQHIGSRRAVEEQSNVSLSSFELMRDAITLRSNDIIDIEAITGNDVPHRMTSIDVQPKERVVKVSAYPEAIHSAENPVDEAIAPPAEGPGPLEDDFASAVFATNDGLLGLRIPVDPRAFFGVVLGSEDGVSYWTVGVVPATGGGEVVLDDGINIWFRSPVSVFTEGIPPADSAAATSPVMLGATSLDEMFSFRSVVDYGEGLWKIEAALRPDETTMAPGDVVYIWRDGTLPFLSDSLPGDAGRKFKVVPGARNLLGNPATADELTEVDAPGFSDLVPGGGTEGQHLTKASDADFDTEWTDQPALEQGVGYYDVPNNYFYITFGVDEDWEAIRYRTVDETTGPNQTGPVPTDLVTLQGLTYT